MMDVRFDEDRPWCDVLAMRVAFPCAALLTLTACVNVKTPDKPIEINLNVNIRQEVVVRLQQDAQQLITDNPELFPK